jgi:DNA-binding SARP family transcriptional activator
MALLWPGLALDSAQQSFLQTLFRLRQVIEPGEPAESGEPAEPFILAERFTLAWNPDAPSTLDVAQFEALSGLGRSPESWQQAADLYRGEFLADFYVADSEAFEEWALNRRAAYHRTAQALLYRLADHYLSQNAYPEAESAVRRSLELDYFQETAHRQLLQTLAASGRRQEALLHFDTLRRRLREEFDLEPEPETADLITAIRKPLLPEVPTSNLPDANLPDVNLPEVGPIGLNLREVQVGGNDGKSSIPGRYADHFLSQRSGTASGSRSRYRRHQSGHGLDGRSSHPRTTFYHLRH